MAARYHGGGGGRWRWSVLVALGFWWVLGVLPAPAAVFRAVQVPTAVNPVGSGARALGMGGAFIGVADDATAASWNPGGLIQLERPEVSVVWAGGRRHDRHHFTGAVPVAGNDDQQGRDLNYLSLTYPFVLAGWNNVVSLSYQYLYDLDHRLGFAYPVTDPLFTGTVTSQVRQEGGLSAMGLAWCVQATPRLAVGLTVNLWQDGLRNNGWRQVSVHRLQATITTTGQPLSAELRQEDDYTFRGTNANLGLFYRHDDRLTVGAVVKTPFRARLHRRSRIYDRTTNPPPVPAIVFSSQEAVDEQLDMPLAYGVGLAWKANDLFTIAADLYRTHWQDFVLTDGAGNPTSPLTGLPVDRSDISATTQFRVGCEYLVLTPRFVIPLRAGAYYDPVPAPGAADDFFGITAGAGLVAEPLLLDVALQYRFGRRAASATLPALGYSRDLDEYTLYTSMIVHF